MSTVVMQSTENKLSEYIKKNQLFYLSGTNRTFPVKNRVSKKQFSDITHNWQIFIFFCFKWIVVIFEPKNLKFKVIFG